MTRNFILTCAALATLCMCSSGQAADMAVKAPPPPPPPPFNWTGFYIGGNVGAVWSSVDIHDNFGDSFTTGGTSAGMVGGQIGFNYQAVGSPFVFGVEFDGDWTGLKRTSGFVDIGIGPLVQAEVSTPWITSLAARFGFAADRFFLYGKAGVGWVSNKLTIRDEFGASISASNTRSGFLFGIGGEYAFSPNWSLKLEYDHINLGDRSITDTNFVVCDCDPALTVTAHRNIDMFKFGFNYRFGWAGAGPAGMRY